MRYFINVVDGYIAGVGTGNAGSEITQAQFEHIIELLSVKPMSVQGYVARLRADNLEWELVELPPVEEPELTADEALDIILGGGAE